MSDESIEFHHSDEWTAVYLDGKLQRVGDSYLADEWLREKVGVTSIYDDAFMRGQSKVTGVAKTLDEVSDFRTARTSRLKMAADLRVQAASLEAQAKELES